jgi:hypothetical protein
MSLVGLAHLFITLTQRDLKKKLERQSLLKCLPGA